LPASGLARTIAGAGRGPSGTGAALGLGRAAGVTEGRAISASAEERPGPPSGSARGRRDGVTSAWLEAGSAPGGAGSPGGAPPASGDSEETAAADSATAISGPPAASPGRASCAPAAGALAEGSPAGALSTAGGLVLSPSPPRAGVSFNTWPQALQNRAGRRTAVPHEVQTTRAGATGASDVPHCLQNMSPLR
jgi:hypothetical protein